jgi:RNA polymerase sigma factor (sigma-70 family)
VERGASGVSRGEERSAAPVDDRTAVFLRLADDEIARGYRTAGYILGNAAEAEEATQDAILHAWMAWPSMRDPERFGPWFERILVNTCLDRIRRRHGVRLVNLDRAPELRGADPFAAGLARDEIGRAIGALPAEQRVVVVLRFWRDLSLQEIADRLTLPLGTIKSRLHYAMRAMRSTLGPDEDGEVER